MKNCDSHAELDKKEFPYQSSCWNQVVIPVWSKIRNNIRTVVSCGHHVAIPLRNKIRNNKWSKVWAGWVVIPIWNGIRKDLCYPERWLQRVVIPIWICIKKIQKKILYLFSHCDSCVDLNKKERNFHLILTFIRCDSLAE